MKKITLAAAAAFLCACGGEQKPFDQAVTILSVPATVRVYGAPPAEAADISSSIIKEWKRISDDFSFTEPFSYTAALNKAQPGTWVSVDAEMLRLLAISNYYYRMTGGAFDVTFAPLWPIWKEAASTKRMPEPEAIREALSNIGTRYIEVDKANSRVRFTRPVQVNFGGILRAYCFSQAYRMLKARDVKWPVELRLGGYMMGYGERDWVYEVADPEDQKHNLGSFRFRQGTVMASSGRDRYVQIEGKTFSHLIDTKTGYPLENFSNLIIYFPNPDPKDNEFIPSAVMAMMGKERTFETLGRMKGTAAVWIDGAGKAEVFANPDSLASWEKGGKLF